MSRLEKEKKEEILRLIKEGCSLNKIKSEIGTGKTTAYYYMRKINGRKIPLTVIKDNDEESVGEVIGLFAGDGSLFHDKKRWTRKIRFTFNKNETLLINYYRRSLELMTSKRLDYIQLKVLKF